MRDSAQFSELRGREEFPSVTFVAFVGCPAVFLLCQRICGDWQRAVLAAFLFGGVSVAAITETLSVFHLVTRLG